MRLIKRKKTWQAPNGELWTEVYHRNPEIIKLARSSMGLHLVKKSTAKDLYSEQWQYLGEISQGYYSFKDLLFELLVVALVVIVFCMVKIAYPDFLNIQTWR